MSEVWRQRPEGGTQFSLRLTVWIARFFGRTVLQLVLIPVAAYFYLFRHAERAASRAFLQQVKGRVPSRAEVFRHFYTFAQVAADRIFFNTGEADNIEVKVLGAGQLRALVAEGRGGIVLAAHLGSFEAARLMGREVGGARVRVVLNRAVNIRLVEQLETLNPKLAEAIIDSEQGAAKLGLAIAEAARQGDWIGFLADRHQPGDATMAADFLGRSAQFPTGPFLIAAALKLPLMYIFPLYLNGRYEVSCELVHQRFELPREDRQQLLPAAIEHFAERLGYFVRLSPYNWFNFYDFWDD